MAKGISIHVGVNAPQAAGINVPPLKGCENDAEQMRLLARARGFKPLNGDADAIIAKGDATYDNVLAKLGLAAAALNAGDIFLFTFAGHGTSRAGSVFETSGDGRDETLVMFDKLVIDNILRRDVWPQFKPGVRVVMIADSCHSGTVAMAEVDDLEDGPSSSTRVYSLEEEDGQEGNGPIVSGLRAVPQDQAEAHFGLLSDFYIQLSTSASSAGDPDPIQASVMLLAACQEFEKTRESTINMVTHGVYTRALLNTWNTDGPMTYEELLNGVQSKLTSQSPVLMMVEETPSFMQTEAFKI